MNEVKKRKKNNEKLRDMFYNIPNIRESIAIRQCRFIGKIVRGPSAYPPDKVLINCPVQQQEINRSTRNDQQKINYQEFENADTKRNE